MGGWDNLRGLFLRRGESASPPETPQELFTREVEALFREAASVESVARVPQDFALTIRRVGGREHTLFLGNLYAETRELGPDQRRERVLRFLRGLDVPKPEDLPWAEARTKLVPLLRTPMLFAGLDLTPEKLPIRRVFAPFLLECVGLDFDDSFQFVSIAALSRWGIEPRAAFEAALETARACFVDDVQPFDTTSPYPIWHVARDDSYESSRLLVPGWLASFEGRVAGRPVAIVPHRSLLVVGGDGDERCLRRLIDSARLEYEAASRRISPALYTVDHEGRVIALSLPDQHPLATEVATGHVMMAESTRCSKSSSRRGSARVSSSHPTAASRDPTVASSASRPGRATS